MRVTLTLLGAVAIPAAALSYEAPVAQSFIKPVPGGKYVFVMLLPGDRDQVGKTFAKSGLYMPADPKAPLWTCDWRVENERSVTLSRDGEWAVRVSDVDAGSRHSIMSKGVNNRFPHQPGWENRPAAFVYHRGQLVRTLTVKETFDMSRFSGNDCFMGPVVQLDPMDAAGRVRLTTVHEDGGRQRATVDTSTGDVTDRDNGLGMRIDDCGNVPEKCGTEPPDEWRWVWVLLAGGAVVGLGTAAVVGLTAWLVRRQKESSVAGSTPDDTDRRRDGHAARTAGQFVPTASAVRLTFQPAAFGTPLARCTMPEPSHPEVPSRDAVFPARRAAARRPRARRRPAQEADRGRVAGGRR